MNAVIGFIIACLALSAQSLPGPQIINGVNAPDGLYPYQALVVDINNRPFCSGAIISNRYIITTAECIVNYIENPYNIYVTVGSNYPNDLSITIRAVNIITHVGYNAKLHLHDIGLIQLSQDIEFKENIQPIILATADRDYDNYPLVITGWGYQGVNEPAPYPNHLQEIIVKGLSQEKCRKSLLYEDIKKTHLCTFTMYGEGMCTGDTGNPVVADGILVGIVSNTKCGYGLPDVSTRVFHYRAWIKYYAGI